VTTSIWKNARSELSEVNEVLDPQNGAPKGQLEDNEDIKRNGNISEEEGVLKDGCMAHFMRSEEVKVIDGDQRLE